MSTATKRSHTDALAEAEAFRGLFSPSSYESWTFAGSLRRGVSDVGDVEHVVVPRFADVPGKDLFATPTRTNLLFTELDSLVALPRGVTKHAYGRKENGDPIHRWGDIYRGVDFGGVMHELFSADDTNLGPTLAIRTGSADFSKRLVTGLLRNGRRNKDGKVWTCRPCEQQRCQDGKTDHMCPDCAGTRLIPVEVIPCGYERHYFELCGMPWVEPRDRR